MKTVVLVIGLPGSGKTYWAKNQGDGYIVDDPLFLDEVIEAINRYDKVYVVDPWLVDSMNLDFALKELGKYCDNIKCVYFENNPEACLKNVKYRNDGRQVTQFIKNYSKRYNPPENSIKVWSDNNE